MKPTLLILAVLCVYTFAMVPRDRFAREVNICAPQTPCLWNMYKSPSNEIYATVTNTYCVCGPGKVCTLHDDDAMARAFVYKCKVEAS